MSRRHIPKDEIIKEREDYRKYILNAGYSPTVDEKHNFSGSDEFEKKLSEPATNRAREISFHQRFGNHISKNYISWIVTGILFLAIFLMYDSKLDISGIKIHLGILKDDITELKVLTKESNNRLHQHDLSLQENKINVKLLRDNLKNSSK